MSDPTYTPKVYKKNNGDTQVVASGGAIEIEAGGLFKISDVDIIALLAALVANPLGGVAAGYTVARGQRTMLSAADTIVTGLGSVVAVIATMESDPILTFDRVTAQIGNQAGAPAAGSIILKGWMPTDLTLTTPIAATGFAGIKVNWVAIGTAAA